jgi:hypothetical protein
MASCTWTSCNISHTGVVIRSQHAPRYRKPDRMCPTRPHSNVVEIRMPSSGMLRRVPLVRADVSKELNISIIRVTRSVCRLLVTANVIPSSQILVTLMMEAQSSSEKYVLIRSTLCNTLEDGILHGHGRESLKSYIVELSWK